MNDPQRILVIRRKAIGDVLVSMDVLRALREAWPGAHIDLVVDRFAAPVAEGSAWVDRLLIYERRLYSEGSPLRRLRATRDWIRRLRACRPDLVLDLMGTPQTAIWSALTGAPQRVGPRRRWRTWAYTHPVEPESSPRFAGERFLDWIRRLDRDPGPWCPHPVPRDREIDEEVRRQLAAMGARDGREIVVLNPSATWPAKAWPLAHFAALGRALQDRRDALVLVAWGPGEERFRETLVGLGEGRLRAMPRTDLKTLAAWLGAADLLVTTDSGPKHLAVGEGRPTLTLFGSTDPRGWHPPVGPHHWLVNDVPCRPCNLRECSVPGHPCLDELEPMRVLAEVEKILDARGRREDIGRTGSAS